MIVRLPETPRLREGLMWHGGCDSLPSRSFPMGDLWSYLIVGAGIAFVAWIFGMGAKGE